MSKILDDVERDNGDLALAFADSTLKTNVMNIGAIMYTGVSLMSPGSTV